MARVLRWSGAGIVSLSTWSPAARGCVQTRDLLRVTPGGERDVKCVTPRGVSRFFVYYQRVNSLWLARQYC